MKTFDPVNPVLVAFCIITFVIMALSMGLTVAPLSQAELGANIWRNLGAGERLAALSMSATLILCYVVAGASKKPSKTRLSATVVGAIVSVLLNIALAGLVFVSSVG